MLLHLCLLVGRTRPPPRPTGRDPILRVRGRRRPGRDVPPQLAGLVVLLVAVAGCGDAGAAAAGPAGARTRRSCSTSARTPCTRGSSSPWTAATTRPRAWTLRVSRRRPRPTRSSSWSTGARTSPCSTSTTSRSRGQGPRPRRRHGARPAAAGRRPGRSRTSAARATSRARRVGVTGVPSDEAVLRAIVGGDGGDPKSRARGDDRLRRGRGARSAAASTRRPRSGTSRACSCADAARARTSSGSRTTARPPYPELVLVRHPPDARRAPGDGPRDRPAPCAAATRRRSPTPRRPSTSLVDHGAGDRAEVARGARRRQPDLRGRRPAAGALDRAALRRWADWEASAGLVDQPPDVDRAFAFGVLGGAGPGHAGQPSARRPTSAAPSRAMRERGTTRSNPAASARSRTSGSTWA